MFIQPALMLAFISSASAVSIPSLSTILKPHIVFMLVDDWGWANVGYHRSKLGEDSFTPNIDSLVKEGLQLDQHYVYCWCAHLAQHFLLEGYPYMSMMHQMQRMLHTTQTIQYQGSMAYLVT